MRFGLGAVKNVGGAAVDAIIEARMEEPYKDLYDFCERVDLRRVNKRVIESLIKCGAFDSTGARRAQMMAALESAAELGQKIQKEKESAQASLFGTAEIVKGNGNGSHVLPDITEWREKDLLAYEKEALGFYITGHPLARYADDVKRLTTADTVTLRAKADKSEVRICGIVASLNEKITKKGDRMAFAVLEDQIGSVELMVFPDTYVKASVFLKTDEPLLVNGIVDVSEENCKVKALDVIPLSVAKEQNTRRVNFIVRTNAVRREQLESLKMIITRYRGDCTAYLQIIIPDTSRTNIKLPDSYSVKACEDMILEVESLFGYNATAFA
jgi:DNA polymerase-3 subunit alpha